MVGAGRLLLSSSLLVAVTGSALAQGQPAEPAPIGLSFGLRAGYGIPGGKIGAPGNQMGDDAPLSEVVDGMIPFVLDIGYRITPRLSLGGFLQYGFGQENKDPENCDDCTVDIVAFGASVYLHAAPGARFDPWVGAGLGYEILGLKTRLFQTEVNVAVEGFQFLVLQAGGDFATGSPITLGPFISLSLGRYDTMTVRSNQRGGTSGSEDLGEAWHRWVSLGVQGRFNL